jgi:hypothetical protein
MKISHAPGLSLAAKDKAREWLRIIADRLHQ